jgi:choline dehydrogenase-like flavoprotein
VDESLTTKVYQFSYPADFSAAYRHELERAADVQVHLNANLVEIVLEDDANRVRHLVLATLDGRRISLQAKAYVLACGGIENVRLLLASNRVVNTGIGNAHDLVGRFFMDHPYFFPGYFKLKSPDFNVNDYVIRDYAAVGCEQRSHLALSLDEETRRREGLNGAALYLVRRDKYKTLPEYMSRGGLALNLLIDVLRHRESPASVSVTDVTDLLGGFGDAAKTLGRQLGSLVHRQWVPGMRVALEMTPCRDSRVVLNDQKDRFGMPRIDVHWQLNERDRLGYYRLLDVLRREFARRNLGEFVTHDRTDQTGWPLAMTGGKHHMGTTRMHADPRQGVVDPDCRVHGVGNLFIAGSSVFPTGGYANPTLTIVALAIRLADHLKSAFKAGSFG